ncbi:MAG: ABC transporter ATP-binding protein, partial [Candidatus Rokuibacteriota bacterium]
MRLSVRAAVRAGAGAVPGGASGLVRDRAGPRRPLLLLGAGPAAGHRPGPGPRQATRPGQHASGPTPRSRRPRPPLPSGGRPDRDARAGADRPGGGQSVARRRPCRDPRGGRGEWVGEDDDRSLRHGGPPAHRRRNQGRRPAGAPPAGGAQNPDLTLNPRRTILEAVARPLRLFGLVDRRTRRSAAARLLEAVGLEPRYLDLFPAQLSGGQRQRVAIARAFACRPDLVVCDEPTSALDVSVQATVLNLLASLQAREHTSYLFISHDLSVVRHIANRVVVLYLGRICEAGPTEEVFAPPWHPYTEVLLSAVPSLSATSVTGT